MASLQGSRPLPRQHSSYFPPAPSSNQQPSSDMETPLKHNVFRFLLTKNILWDQTPVGSSFQLHPMHTRNISLHVSEAAVRLAHRHTLQADVQPYHGFLVGSVQVDADEEGLTVSLDRFDPGRDVPDRNARLPTASLPADFIVPLTTCLGDADISATHTSEDFIAAFKLLESNVSTHGSVDLSRCLTLRVLCRCHSNADDITFSLHFGAVTVATVLNGFPVKPVPIIPTALARNLMGPLSLSDVQGSYKTGFLSMDETRKLLLLLESDPKATTIPLVGIWLSGITHMSNPVVWSACLRYLNSTGIQERVCSPDGSFLVVLFTHTSRQPLFYQCKVKSEQEPRFMLVGCRENLHVFKHVSGKGKPPVEMELTPARSGPSKSLFMQSLAHLRSSQKHSISSSRRRSSASDSMSTEESQLMPRPSPKPILDKSPSVMPSVPELSFISDSFCEPTDQRRKDQVPADVHPQHKEGRTIHRQRLNGQSDTVKGTNKQMSVHRRRLHGTSKTPPQGHQQHSPGMKGTNQISRQNRPGPLRALNGQELNDNRKKGGHSSETHDMRKRASQPKDKAGKVLHTKSSGFGLHQKHANGPRQGRHSAVRSSQQHLSECIERDRQMCPNVHGRPGNRMQHQQQPKVSFQDQVECDIEPSPVIIANYLHHQHQSDAVSVDMESVLPPHQQPDIPTGHYHSPINNLVNAQPTLPSHSPPTMPISISQEGQSYPETSDHHHQDNATTNGPFHPAPKTVTSSGHLHPMTTLPEENVLSPEHSVTQKSKDVVGVQSAPSSIDRRSNAPVSGDQSQSREPSDMDIRTLEQLRRQEEMIQQLQEQIKLLLQAHSPHPSTSTPLGLMTPPATPQGAPNMVQSPPAHSPAETGSFRSHPDSIQPPSAAVPSHRHHMRDATAPQSTAAVKPDTTGVATLVVHQQTAIAASIEQSSKTPVMCSMAVNTGQSLFWSIPVDGTNSDAPGSPGMKSDQAQPKITRRSSMTTPVLSPMPDPDSTSTPVATQCGQERQSSDVQEGFTNVLQTRKVMERVDIGSCQETTRKSSHSTESSEQHTPIQSPERSHQDESNHTFGANLSSPALGESASTYAPPRPQTDSSDSDDEEEDEEDRRVMEKEKRTSMASPSLLYRDERKFYDNLLGQVQQLLHTDGSEKTNIPDPVITEGATDPDLPCALPDISLATLEELEKLGINLHSRDITVTDRSLYRSLYNVSPDLHPHINYVSLADFTFDPSDLSMEANAIAMKYLSDSELAKMSADIQGDKTPGRRGGGGGGVNPLLRSVLTGIRGDGGASSRGGDVDSSIGVNMSLASRKYMEKYGLLSGSEGAASPRGDGHLLKPSPVRFMKSPAIVRTNLPRDGMKEDKRGVKARPTRLSYSPSREMDSHRTEAVGLNAPKPRDADLTSDPKPPNVLGNLKAQKLDKSEEDSGAKGNILDISKLKQLPKLL